MAIGDIQGTGVKKTPAASPTATALRGDSPSPTKMNGVDGRRSEIRMIQAQGLFVAFI